MYQALARKYRPQSFAEVIGQDPVVKTLSNAIAMDRVHHAYLFCGARGVGKTSLARIYAKSLNCENGPTPTPCQTCDSCESITSGKSLDVIEIDAASNTGVDNIRELREQVKYAPQGRYKIYIIDEVHMLSNSAFNALLKTLEEPPAHVIFLLATTEPHEIPITILSRCQRFDCRKVNAPVLQEHLKRLLSAEKITKFDDPAIHMITDASGGSVRDAVSLLDQVIGYGGETINEEEVRSILGLGERLSLQECFRQLVLGDLSGALASLAQVDEQGLDLKVFAEDLLRCFRHLILAVSTKSIPEDISSTEKDFYQDLSSQADLSLVLSQYQILFQGLRELSFQDFQRTSLEMTFVKLSQAAQMLSLTDLIVELKNRQSRKGKPATVSVQPRAEKTAVVKTQASPQVSGDWYDFVKWVKSVKPPVGSYLSEATPLNYSDQKVEVAYPKNSPNHQMVIERKTVVEEILEQHFGKKVPFVISTLGDEKKKL